MTDSSYSIEKVAIQDRLRGVCSQWAARRSASGLKRGLRDLAHLTDRTLQKLYDTVGFPDSAVALVAVGGYGRGFLFPGSDVDVLIVSQETLTLAQEEKVRLWVSSAWDVGLVLAPSVRTVKACVSLAAQDMTVQTSLLDIRYLAGDRETVLALQQACRQALNPVIFWQGKLAEMHQRHRRFANTADGLEPHVKESPGALRDLHVLRWIAQAAGWGDTPTQWVHAGLVTPAEKRRLGQLELFLSTIRTQLHLLTGRSEDKLIFDVQIPMALALGYGKPETGTSGLSHLTVGTANHQEASQVFMRQYYRAAKAINQLRQVILWVIQEKLDPLPSEKKVLATGFVDQSGYLEIIQDDLYQSQPHLLLKTFEIYQQTPSLVGLSARTWRALEASGRQINTAFRQDSRNRVAFLQILQFDRRTTHTLRLMNEAGVLGRYLRPFGRIVGQMQHDLFHVYTVDQHILTVVGYVRRFFIPERAQEFPFCAQLAADFEKPWLLSLAALFHDIAKGQGGDHSVLGAEVMRCFCREHDLNPIDTDLVCFLVKEHLLMSQIAQKQDLSDPQVIRRFAEKVATPRRLTALYLLTVADIRGTSPKVWNQWKARLLEDLYQRTIQMLGGKAIGLAEQIQQAQQATLALLAGQGVMETPPVWAHLNVSYFVRHSSDEMAWHALSLRSREESSDSKTTLLSAPCMPCVQMRHCPQDHEDENSWQIFIYTQDSPDLFARICAYFDRQMMNVWQAQLYTTAHGYALDSFVVRVPYMPEFDSSDRKKEQAAWVTSVAQDFARHLSSHTALPALRPARLSRRAQFFPIHPQVFLQAEEGKNHTDRPGAWLSITASDRPGLLYTIAHVLATLEINIEFAKITTLGERAEDHFFISGLALHTQSTWVNLETALLRVLEPHVGTGYLIQSNVK